jgi:hypothetical protein
VRESIGEHSHFVLRRQSGRRWTVWENLDLARERGRSDTSSATGDFELEGVLTASGSRHSIFVYIEQQFIQNSDQDGCYVTDSYQPAAFLFPSFFFPEPAGCCTVLEPACVAGWMLTSG